MRAYVYNISRITKVVLYVTAYWVLTIPAVNEDKTQSLPEYLIPSKGTTARHFR